MVEELTDDKFDQAVEKGLVVVDLWAPWCGPCRAIAPIVEELAGEFSGKASFYKLNIDDHKKQATKHQVMGIPTLLLFKDGKLADQIVGAAPKEKIKSKLSKLL